MVLRNEFTQVAEVLGNGTGEFDEERLLKQLPEALNLPEKRVKAAIQCALSL